MLAGADEESGTRLGKFSIGLEESYIFERKMDLSSAVVLPAGLTGSMELKDLGRTMLRVGYQPFKNLNIYTKLGATNDDGGFEMNVDGPIAYSGYPAPPIGTETFAAKVKYEADSDFVWALGFKLLFPLQNRWIIGADAQYLTHENDYSGKETIRFYDGAGVLLGSDSGSTDDAGTYTISEWHVAPFIAKDFKWVVPYVGFKYSELEINREGEDSVDARENIGIFAGANFKFTDRFYLNLEGRFLDETAATLAAMFNF